MPLLYCITYAEVNNKEFVALFQLQGVTDKQLCVFLINVFHLITPSGYELQDLFRVSSFELRVTSSKTYYESLVAKNPSRVTSLEVRLQERTSVLSLI